MVAALIPVDPRFRWRTLALHRGHAELHLSYDPAFSRPGGTISGPTLFTLADLTLWAAVLSVIGMQPLAVTAHMTINFLRRPPAAGLVARCDILKPGRRLLHGDVRIFSDGSDQPVCHATGAYAAPELPPNLQGPTR